MPDLYKMHEELEELEEYVDWEGSEVGEMCQSLIQLAGYPDYMSDELKQAVAKEIVDTLEMFRERTEWVEKEVTVTRKTKELVWK